MVEAAAYHFHLAFPMADHLAEIVGGDSLTIIFQRVTGWLRPSDEEVPSDVGSLRPPDALAGVVDLGSFAGSDALRAQIGHLFLAFPRMGPLVELEQNVSRTPPAG